MAVGLPATLLLACVGAIALCSGANVTTTAPNATSVPNTTNVTNATGVPLPPPRYVVRNGTRFTATHTPAVARHVTDTASASPTYQQSKSLSDTVSRSHSERFSGGFLAWDRTPGEYDLSFLPTFLADDLTTRSITVELQLLSDEFDVPFLRSNPAQAFKLTNFSLLKPAFLQARGIIGQSKVDRVLTASSLAWFNTSVVRITFFMNDFIQLSSDETVGVTFLANATRSKVAPKNVAQIVFTATRYTRDVALFSALGAVSAISAAMTIATGMPGTHQLQAVAMIGSMTCVDAPVQAFTQGGQYFLLPIAFDPSTSGQLMSIIAIVGYVSAAHITCCRVIRSNVARMTMQEAMSRTRFPSIPYGLVVILFPGFVYFLGQFTYEVIDGGLTVLVYSIAGLAVVCLTVLVRMLILSPSFLDRRFAFDPVRSASCLGLLTRPVGKWGPPEIIAMYRTAIAPVAAHSDKFMLIIFLESGVTAAITSYQSYSQDACNAQFAILAFFNIGCGILYVGKAPYRYFFDNVISTLMNAALLVMTLTNAVTANQQTLIDAYKAAIAVAIVLGGIRCGLAFAVVMKEDCCSDEQPTRSPRVRLPGREDDEVTVVPPRNLRRRLEDDPVIPQVESEGGSSDEAEALPAARASGLTRTTAMRSASPRPERAKAPVAQPSEAKVVPAARAGSPRPPKKMMQPNPSGGTTPSRAAPPKGAASPKSKGPKKVVAAPPADDGTPTRPAVPAAVPPKSKTPRKLAAAAGGDAPAAKAPAAKGAKAPGAKRAASPRPAKTAPSPSEL